MVPAHPGLLCAHGLLVADVRADFSLSRIAHLKDAGAQGMNAAFAELQRSADEWFAREHVEAHDHRIERALDMRYVGQSHELTVVVQPRDFCEADLQVLVSRFRDEHVRVYGHVFAPDGSHLGSIKIHEASNVAWGDDGSVLYITSSKAIYRIQTLTAGHGI